MLSKIIFRLSLLMLMTTGAFSQNAINSQLDFKGNFTTEEFSFTAPVFRYSVTREGFVEITDMPDYVWQDISRHLRNYYGNRSPRVGDVFVHFVNYRNIAFTTYFRIDRVDGTRVAGWTRYIYYVL